MLEVDFIRRYRKNGKNGLKYLQSGMPITDAKYDDIRRIKGTNEYVKVKYENKWGVINCLGKSALGVKYDDICCYENNAFKVLIDGKYQYKEPNIIIPNPPKREPYSVPIGIRLGHGRKR